MNKLVIGTAALCAAFTMACAESRQTRVVTPPDSVQTTTAESGVIPAGTEFAIRTHEEIDSKQPRKIYMAEVAQDIKDQSGRLLVPKGSEASLEVIETSEGGAVGTPSVELAVRSVKVRGTDYRITTGGVEQEGKEGLGKNRRTAEMVGGGAAIGTVIGAVVGGGKGAAVGAAVGAAGGAAAQVLTRGKEVHVPAETVLTFRLDQPWRLQGYS